MVQMRGPLVASAMKLGIHMLANLSMYSFSKLWILAALRLFSSTGYLLLFEVQRDKSYAIPQAVECKLAHSLLFVTSHENVLDASHL